MTFSMNVTLLALALSTGLIPAAAGAGESHKVWTIKTDEDVKSQFFLDDGRYFFVRAKDYLYLFDGEGGKQVWSSQVAHYEKKGPNIRWGDDKKYIVSNSQKELLCYDVYTGKILWQQKYPDINQGDYLGYDELKEGEMLQYGNMDLMVDFETGKELWRGEHEPNGHRHGSGLPTFWSTRWKADNRILFATSDGLVLVDAKTGKNLWKTKDNLTSEEKVRPVTYYGKNALIMYEDDKIGFVDLVNGKELWSKKTKVGDIEGYFTIKNVNGNDYLLMSFDDTQTMVNLTSGTIEWETKPGELIGMMKEYRILDGGKNLLCYIKQKRKSGDESGTYFVLCKLEMATGKVIYKEKIAFTDWSPAASIFKFILNAEAKFIDAFSKTKTFSNALEPYMKESEYGFSLTEYAVDGDAVFLIRGDKGSYDMKNPTTRDGDGEGLVRINLETGKVAYRSYFPLNKTDFKLWGADFDYDAAPKPIVQGDNLYVVGAERVVSANLKTGQINWKIDKDLGFPVSLHLYDNTLFLRVGHQAFDVSVDAKSGDINAKKAWNKDPYRLYALDPAAGTVIWKTDFQNDAGLGMEGNRAFIDSVTKTFYGADEKEMFAVRLSREGGGKRLWSLKFDDDMKIGNLDHDKCFAVTRHSSSSASSEYSYNSGYNYTTVTTTYEASATQVLYPVVHLGHIVVCGPSGIAGVTTDGKVQWSTKWDWDPKKVTLPPYFLSSGKIVTMLKGNIQLLDENSGKLFWKEEANSDATPIIPPNNKWLYLLEKDEVAVYTMTE
jgi:outer membrane protein assembly factor BamB